MHLPCRREAANDADIDWQAYSTAAPTYTDRLLNGQDGEAQSNFFLSSIVFPVGFKQIEWCFHLIESDGN